MEDIWAPLRAELARDYVGLWEVVRRTRAVAPEFDDDRVRETVLEVLGSAVRNGEAEAGTFHGGPEKTFTAWQDPPAAIIERVALEWTQLGRDPNIGEVVWLRRPRPADDP